jgi:hypothetical protein
MTVTIRDPEALSLVILEMEDSVRHLRRGVSALLQSIPDGCAGNMPANPNSFKLLCDHIGFIADGLHLAADVVHSNWAVAWEAIHGPEEEALDRARAAEAWLEANSARRAAKRAVRHEGNVVRFPGASVLP